MQWLLGTSFDLLICLQCLQGYSDWLYHMATLILWLNIHRVLLYSSLESAFYLFQTFYVANSDLQNQLLDITDLSSWILDFLSSILLQRILRDLIWKPLSPEKLPLFMATGTILNPKVSFAIGLGSGIAFWLVFERTRDCACEVMVADKVGNGESDTHVDVVGDSCWIWWKQRSWVWDEGGTKAFSTLGLKCVCFEASLREWRCLGRQQRGLCLYLNWKLSHFPTNNGFQLRLGTKQWPCFVQPTSSALRNSNENSSPFLS